MRNTLTLILGLCVVLLSNFIVANPSNQLHIGNSHFEVPHNWSVTNDSSNYTTTIVHNDGIATLNISIRDLSNPITAIELQHQRSISYFDGWITALNAPLAEDKIRQARTSDGHKAVYVQQALKADLSVDEKLIAEYYYTTPSRYYLISLSCNKDHLAGIKADLERFYQSFWVGEDQTQPAIIKDNIDLSNWNYQGNKHNQNFVLASPVLDKPLSPLWSQVISSKTLDKDNDIPYIINNNQFFSLNNNKLSKLNSRTGIPIWEYTVKNDTQKFLAYHANLLFIIERATQTTVKALSTDSGEVIYSRHIDSSNGNPVFLGNYYYSQTANNINCYNALDGKLIWSKTKKLQNSTLIATSKALIAQLSNNAIIALNPETGDDLWEIEHYPLSQAMISNEKTLYLPTKKSSSHDELHSINLENGEREWVFEKSLFDFRFSEAPSLSNQQLVVVGTINNKNPYDEKTIVPVLINVNLKTGKSSWEKELTDPITRPILTENHIVYTNPTQNKINLLEGSSGEEITINNVVSTNESLQQLMLHKKTLYIITEKDRQLIIKAFE